MPDSLELEGTYVGEAASVKSTVTERVPLLARVSCLLREEGGPLLFVWLVWLVLSRQLWNFVIEHGRDIPYMDDWEMVPVLMGEQPITLKWLWSLHNEHRIVMPRLIYLAVTR